MKSKCEKYIQANEKMSRLVQFCRTITTSASRRYALPTPQNPAEARKLKQVELDFMKLIENKNLLRVQKLQKLRRRNNLLGGAVGISVVSIYLYSMFAIKQEKFLDDFNEPQKVSAE